MSTFTGREVSMEFDDTEITVQSVEFSNKRVLFIKMNGEVDTTFDVKAPDSQSFYETTSQSDPFSDFVCDKKCLIGQATNLKLSILVNHVSKLLFSHNETRNLILMMSSKLFDIKTNQSDMDLILKVLATVKEVL